MFFPVTTLSAGVLGLWFLVLSYRVIRARQTANTMDNATAKLNRRIRGHANFSEYVPIMLILCAMLEYSGALPMVLWASAGAMVLGRLLHGYAFAFSDHSPIGRSGGTALTLIALAVLSIANIAVGLSMLG